VTNPIVDFKHQPGGCKMEPTESTTARETMTVDIESVRSSYNRNLNASMDRLQQESEIHGGELVARSADGVETFGYANSYDELFSLLDKKQIDLHEVVIARVASLDEGCLF
jgi:hypothetical protein